MLLFLENLVLPIQWCTVEPAHHHEQTTIHLILEKEKLDSDFKTFEYGW